MNKYDKIWNGNEEWVKETTTRLYSRKQSKATPMGLQHSDIFFYSSYIKVVHENLQNFQEY